MREPLNQRQAGLSLVEVLLALAILGGALVGFLATTSRCLSVARKAKLYSTARELVARVEVEKPLQIEKDIEDAAGNGAFDPPYEAYRWERTVEQEGEEKDALYKVKTVVSWSENGKNASEEVVTYVYAPESQKDK